MPAAVTPQPALDARPVARAVEHRGDRLENTDRQLADPPGREVTVLGFHGERLHEIAETGPPVRVEIQFVTSFQRAQPQPART